MIRYLKTKIFYMLLLCMTAGVLVAQPPDPINQVNAADPKLGGDGDSPPPTQKCVDIELDVTYINNVASSNANVLDLNCPGNTILNIDIQFDWKDFYCFYPQFCDYYVIVKIDDVVIGYEKIIKNQTSFTGSINMSKFDDIINELGKGKKELKVIVMADCVNSIYKGVLAQQSVPLQIINSADLSSSFYTTTQWVKDKLVTICDKTQKVYCCAKEPSCSCIIFKKENIDDKFKEVISGTKNIQSFSLKIDVKGDLYGVSGSGGISNQYEWSTSENNGFRFNYKTTILVENKLCPEPGESFYPMWKYEESCYQEIIVQANCDGIGKIISRGNEFCVPKLDANGNLFLLPYNSKECTATIAEGCKKPRPSATFASNSGYFRNNCTGNLTVSDLGEGVDPATTQVWWTDQNGNVYKGPNHQNVPIGTYTLHIKNECCDYWTQQYRICDNPIDGPWISQGDKFCKEVICAGCSYTECVTPDRIDDEFDQNQKKCIKKFYHNNVLLGTTIVDATSETEWDDFTEECVTKYLCNGSEVYEEEYEPTESEWEYDEFNEECRRNVNCRGEEFENVEQVEAEIEWEWDDFFDECVSTYLACDGTELNQEIMVEPYELGEWRFVNGECVREVTCIDGGSSFDITGDIEYEEDPSSTECAPFRTYYIFCDGDETDEFVCVNGALDRKTNITELNDNLKIEVYDSEVIIKCKDLESDFNYSLHIYDIMGRVISQEKTFNASETKKLKVSDMKTGIYLISILRNGQKYHAQKVFIQN